MTPLAGELTVRQLGEMLRGRGGPNLRAWMTADDEWRVSIDGWSAGAADLQDALMLAVSRVDEARRG